MAHVELWDVNGKHWVGDTLPTEEVAGALELVNAFPHTTRLHVMVAGAPVLFNPNNLVAATVRVP